VKVVPSVVEAPALAKITSLVTVPLRIFNACTVEVVWLSASDCVISPSAVSATVPDVASGLKFTETTELVFTLPPLPRQGTLAGAVAEDVSKCPTFTSGPYSRYGLAFELSPKPPGGCPSGSNNGIAWCETVLYSFTSNPDGAFPFCGLTFDSSGNLYGTTIALLGLWVCLHFFDWWLPYLQNSPSNYARFRDTGRRFTCALRVCMSVRKPPAELWKVFAKDRCARLPGGNYTNPGFAQSSSS
jgi:hypothetical protein